MPGKPTMNEVASEARVSLGTVSKVLNGNSTVAAELRSRVLAACQLLNYQHNRIAASLRSRQTHTIGLIVPDILNTFYAALVEKVENLASSAGYTMMIVTTGENPQAARERIRVLKERQVDGMIVIPSFEGSEVLAPAIGSDMPCVIADRISAADVYPSVATDNFDAAYQGAKYILSLGHRQVTLAVNTPRLCNSRERIAGFEHAMAERKATGDVRIRGNDGGRGADLARGPMSRTRATNRAIHLEQSGDARRTARFAKLSYPCAERYVSSGLR